MKLKTALIDGSFLQIKVLESLEEFKEGARLTSLLPCEGLFFDFSQATYLQFENANVNENLTVLLFDNRYNNTLVVSEVMFLQANDTKVKTSKGIHRYALEIPTEYYYNNQLGKGSIMFIREEIDV